MEKYYVTGGRPLKGEITVSGAKNAAVAILPATVLASGRFVLENIPNISDIKVLITILKDQGASVKWLSQGVLEIDTSTINTNIVPYDMAKLLRASYYFLGAYLGKVGCASVSMPGGCDFGVRPIDQHIKGFEALGADISIDGGMINANSTRLLGAHIHFDVVTVGATINVMMAAVRAKGVTILENAAREPHIVDLANFLNSMGADIRGAGTSVIKIHGVDLLRPSNYSIIPDQIEAGTYMVLAAATQSDLLVKNVIPKHLESITDKLISIGAVVEEYDDSVRVVGSRPINKLNIKTMPHPGFPTDMQPQFAALLAMSNGTSIITESIWGDGRFRYADGLKRMGANIQVDGKVAVIEGVQSLNAAPVRATDLRAGVALIIAALVANGTTQIEDIHYIQRGYENLVDKLIAIGADIKEVDDRGYDSSLQQA